MSTPLWLTQPGLPALDLIIVYNNDSSTDDQTPTTFVRRYWDPNLPAISYTTPTPGGVPESGPIFGVTCAPPIGTPLNGLPPQNLDAASNPVTSACPKQFSEIGNTGNTVPLRGTLNTGSGPGDAPPNIGSGGVGIGGLTRGPAADNFAHGMGVELYWSKYEGLGQLLFATTLIVQTIWSGHHYFMQAFGVSLACAQQDGLRLKLQQKRILLANLYALWIMHLAMTEGSGALLGILCGL